MSARTATESPQALEGGTWELIGSRRVWVADTPTAPRVDFIADLVAKYEHEKKWKRDLEREAKRQARAQMRKSMLTDLGVEPCHVRFWARRNGVRVADSGVLPLSLIASFAEAVKNGGYR